jgi:hypothetical protein
VTLTYALESGHRRRGLEDRLRELVERLPVITEALERTGAGIARPASAQQVCEMVRVAYDPGIEGPLEDARAAGHLPTLSWSDVGPHYADAKAGYYKHDSGYSITWAMSDAPRAHVTHTVLERLLAPHPAIDRKRVTLIYRPLDPGESARHAAGRSGSADPSTPRRRRDVSPTAAPRRSSPSFPAAMPSCSTDRRCVKGEHLFAS